MNEIEKFVDTLSKVCNLKNSLNLYDDNTPHGKARKENLILYLNKIKHINPSIIIVGEAPGYRGCKVTGIPFTSEKVLKENIFFSDLNVNFLNSITYHTEVSASKVWSVLNDSKTDALLWNIYPFHPYNSDRENSNRTPTKEELEIGLNFLKGILGLFEIKVIIAIGRTAEQQIKSFTKEVTYIRHPANGGTAEFEKGFKNFLKKLNFEVPKNQYYEVCMSRNTNLREVFNFFCEEYQHQDDSEKYECLLSIYKSGFNLHYILRSYKKHYNLSEPINYQITLALFSLIKYFNKYVSEHKINDVGMNIFENLVRKRKASEEKLMSCIVSFFETGRFSYRQAIEKP